MAAAAAAAPEEHPNYLPEASRIPMDKLLDDLGKGTVLYKVKSASRLLERKFILDMKDMTFRYEGSQKRFRSAKTSVKISSIREVREGEKDFSKKFQDLNRSLCLAVVLAPEDSRSMCFSVVLGASHTVLYLMAMRKEVRDSWLRGLRYALQVDKLAEQGKEIDKWIRDAFNLADRNNDGSLDLEEIMKLLKTLNADIKKKYVKQMFDEADTKKSHKRDVPTLDREEFVKFYHLLTRRQELEELFLRCSRGKGFLNIRDLLSFLHEGQKMAFADEDYCREIIRLHEPQPSFKQKEQLSLVGFRNYLTDEKQFLFNPACNVVYQDMHRPFTHYFVASSHNTYLAEDQLRGPSRVEAYITALKKGCRCVELDCWDGSEGEPVIYHGHTLTSKILFKDVILAIRQYAFQASPYPLTLSLENHCSIPQQHQMATHLQNILGEFIYPASDNLDHIPSPEELKMKIIIKGKRLARVTVRVEETVNDDDACDVSDEDEAAEADTSTSNTLNRSKVQQPQQQQSQSSDKKIKLSPELSNITAMKSVGFKNVAQARQVDNPFCVFSLGESKVERLMQTNAVDLNAIAHSKLLRIYPAGTRTDSSNYNPTPMWNHGCQIVALNYQTPGEAMQLNHGRFLDNGGSGYILKPNFLLSESMFGIVNGTVETSSTKLIKIMVISGFQIPKPKDSKKGEVIDPFVKMEIHGVASDRQEAKTKTIDNNGFNPRWNEIHTFKVRVPELAIMRFVVRDEDRGFDDFIGYYCLPVSCMQEGYRHIPLFDKHGEKFSQSLIFLHVSITNVG